MGKGLKVSKTAVFNLTFERYPDSGTSTTKEIEEFDDYYIAGVGTETLPATTHDPKYVDKVGRNVRVYLQDKDCYYNHKWNKTLKQGKDSEGNPIGIFSDTISKIPSTEFGDLNLKAKWTQFILQGNQSYDRSGERQEWVTIPSGTVLFSWDGNK